MRRQPELRAKVVFMGNSGVGKTSIILRDIEKFTSDVTSTLGVNFVQSSIAYRPSKVLELEIWDTVGTEKYACTMPCYLRHANGVFLVFDVTSRRSFKDLSRWYGELENATNVSGLCLILVGNKIDLDDKRTVDANEAKEFAKLKSMVSLQLIGEEIIILFRIYVETSALLNRGIEEMMGTMGKLIVDRYECKHLSSQSKIECLDSNFIKLKSHCNCN